MTNALGICIKSKLQNDNAFFCHRHLINENSSLLKFVLKGRENKIFLKVIYNIIFLVFLLRLKMSKGKRKG